MKRRSRKPHTDQPLLPLRDTVRTGSDLDREVERWAQETRREPIDGQQELPVMTSTEWVERHLEGAMSLDDDEPYTPEEIELQRRYPTDYDRTPREPWGDERRNEMFAWYAGEIAKKNTTPNHGNP